MFITITTPPVDRDAGLGRKALHIVAVTSEVAAAILFGPIRLHEDRKLRRTMAAMSDHELSDIGLSRQDVVDIAALPLASDVGGFLSGRATERRRR